MESFFQAIRERVLHYQFIPIHPQTDSDKADGALYNSKHSGDNRDSYYDSGPGSVSAMA
jgi:hypothetical protein